MRHILIQPTTTERNLSGVCYKIYWTYVALREAGYEAEIHEDVTLWKADAIIRDAGNAQIILDLSSYPQIDMALDLFRAYGPRLSFCGYSPLIDRLRLPEFNRKVDLLTGAWAYPYYYEHFDRGLLSDCDAHLACEGTGKPVVPVFLSVGCRRRCPYCYVGTPGYPYGDIPPAAIERLLRYVDEKGWNVHFCDEDFYRSPALDATLTTLRQLSIRWIALATSITLGRAIEKHSTQKLLAAGCALNEIGLETTEADVLEKKQDLAAVLSSGLRTLWLAVTFFPNETITSIGRMGEFLAAYGFAYGDMVPRLRTNGTAGGLGQFFQPYEGTPWGDRVEDFGRMLTERPTRLWPSFVGNAFLACRPEIVQTLPQSAEKWFALYGHTLDDVRSVMARLGGVEIGAAFSSPGDFVILAQLARLGIIR